MSLPPIAPPPPVAPVAAAAAGLPSRRQPPSERPAAPSRKGAPSEAPPAKPPRRGRGAPAEHPGPLVAGAWLQQRKEPRSRGAPGGSSSSRCPTTQAAAAAGGGTAAPRAGPALARGRQVGRSCQSPAASPGGGGRGEAAAAAAVRFSLSLPPEALRVLQRRSLESRSPQSRPRAWAPRSACPDVAKCPLAGSAAGADWRALLQVSLLNERHRYDDVEYEEEEEEEDGGPPGAVSAREGLVRKCTEWLRGVESAASQERADKLDSLPHLSTL